MDSTAETTDTLGDAFWRAIGGEAWEQWQAHRAQEQAAG